MKYFFLIKLLIFNFTILVAQNNSRIGVGLNISNNFSNLVTNNYSYSGGFALEPTLVYKIHKNLIGKLTIGYSKISNERTLKETINSFQKINYVNKGIYVKTGINVIANTDKRLFNHSIGLSIGYSNFFDKGNYFIGGEYFGDLTVPYKTRTQKVFFIEPNIDLILFNYKRFTLLTNFNLPVPFYSSVDDNYPSYYIPGYGERFDFKNMLYFSYRFNIHLMYTF